MEEEEDGPPPAATTAGDKDDVSTPLPLTTCDTRGEEVEASVVEDEVEELFVVVEEEVVEVVLPPPLTLLLALIEPLVPLLLGCMVATEDGQLSSEEGEDEDEVQMPWWTGSFRFRFSSSMARRLLAINSCLVRSSMMSASPGEWWWWW